MWRKPMVALGGAALALLMVSALSFPVAAKSGGSGGWHSGSGGARAYHSYSGRFSGVHPGSQFSGNHRFHHRHFDRRIFIGGPAYYYYDDSYGYTDGCYWLRRRALATGSPYWWSRYEACLSGYDY